MSWESKRRDKIKVLYGSDPDEERLIDVKEQKKLIDNYHIALCVLTVILIVAIVVFYRIDANGYVVGFGQLSSGEKYFGIVNIVKVQAQYAADASALDFSYLNVIDIFIVGGLASLVLYLMCAITILDKVSVCKKTIKAYDEYMRRRAILEEEERLREQERLHNKIVNSKMIRKESVSDED